MWCLAALRFTRVHTGHRLLYQGTTATETIAIGFSSYNPDPFCHFPTPYFPVGDARRDGAKGTIQMRREFAEARRN